MSDEQYTNENGYKLTREEQETHVSQTAQERINGVWRVDTDDPVTQRRMEKIGARLIGDYSWGGKRYELDGNQVRFYQPITDAQRESGRRLAESWQD